MVVSFLRCRSRSVCDFLAGLPYPIARAAFSGQTQTSRGYPEKRFVTCCYVNVKISGNKTPPGWPLRVAAGQLQIPGRYLNQIRV